MSNDDLIGDDQLIELLGDAIKEGDAPPASLIRFANNAHRLIGFDAELAQIIADSAGSEPALSRSDAGPRVLELTSSAAHIRIEVDGTSTLGSIEPAPQTIELVTAESRMEIPVNGRGFFRFEAPAAAFRLEFVIADQAVRTEWLSFG